MQGSFGRTYRARLHHHVGSFCNLSRIRLKSFGSPDLSLSLMNRLSDRDSVDPNENSFEMLGTPVKTCLIYKGPLVKTYRIFWQSKLFWVRSPSSVVLHQVFPVIYMALFGVFLCIIKTYHMRASANILAFSYGSFRNTSENKLQTKSPITRERQICKCTCTYMSEWDIRTLWDTHRTARL